MAQIPCCTRSPRNHCPFYVCSACFFQHKKWNLKNGYQLA
jgi:hypothetical protein